MQLIETYGFIAEYDEKNTPQYSELKDAIERLCRSAESYSKIYNTNDDKQCWFDKIKQISAQFGFADNMKDYKLNPQNYKGSVADISGLIRVAVTTRKNTPDLYYLMQLLGEQSVKERINHLIKLLSK